MGEYVKSQATAANYGQQAIETRTNALTARRQAYANAYGLEENSAQSAYITGQQMATMRQNQSAAIAATRLANASGGIDPSGGSKLRQEQSTAQILEETIANLGQSYTISDQNARRQAARLRKEGDDTYTLGQIMANYYSRAARINSTAANWQLLGGSTATIGDTLLKFNI